MQEEGPVNIIYITRNATEAQLRAAVSYASDALHVPWREISPAVAVAYVMKHYGEGRIGGPEIQGWDGFLADT